MTELERIAYAKTFIDKLANGINPLDNQPVSEQDVINNVKLARCFFYVSDVLRRVIENGGIAPHKKQSSRPFYITPEQLSHYSYSKTPHRNGLSARHIGGNPQQYQGRVFGRAL